MAQSDSGVKHIHSSDSYSVNMALSNAEVVTCKVYHLQADKYAFYKEWNLDKVTTYLAC